MNRNLKYGLWLFTIAFAAILFGQFVVSPGKVERGVAKASSHSRSRAKSRNSNKSAEQPTEQQVQKKTVEETKPAPKVNSVGELQDYITAEKENITSVVSVNGANTLEFKLESGTSFSFICPEGESRSALLQVCRENGIAISARNLPPPKLPSTGFLHSFGPTILLCIIIVAIFLYTSKRNGGGFGKSKASNLDDLKGNFKPVSFEDIAGCDEAVRELIRVVNGLVDAKIYLHFDAKRPKGVLLIGPPGTGKTLLARAVATACDGSMDVVSGSDFVEMFVGVGASRVRDMVKNGKKKIKQTGKPHIIFIDELDGIGAARGGKSSVNRHEEREQTLNAILVEMDGLASSEGLIWIAATNRPEILDKALLRPGRFDCQVYVDRPDKAGREKIFGIHTKSKPLAPEVTLEVLATRSYGYTGAEIELACNRAALLAAEEWTSQNEAKLGEMRSAGWSEQASPTLVPATYGISMAGFAHTTMVHSPAPHLTAGHQACIEDDTAVITLKHFDEAIDFVRYGDARESRQAGMQEAEKKNTAYHEAGHAITAKVMPGSDPVAKVTIMSRSKALGYVQQIPDTDKYSITDQQLISRIVMAMAGRAAQEVYLGVCDSGAQNDFQQAVDTARKMVMEWGMSSLGFLAMGARSGFGMSTGYEGGDGISCGSDLANAIDREWQRIVNECYRIARLIVEKEKERMEAVVAILMDQETILKHEWQDLMAKHPSQVTEEEVAFDPKAKPDTDSDTKKGEAA